MNSVRYVGPANQLRGKTGIVRVTKNRETVPEGFLAVQFDQFDLVVAGKSMSHGWALIKEEYLRPWSPEAAVMSISSAKSKRIARRGRDALVNFDLGRMKAAVSGPRFAMPDNLSREELRVWLCEKADEIKRSRALEGEQP